MSVHPELDTDWLTNALASFSESLPVCVDLPHGRQDDVELLDIIRRHGAGLCWHAGAQPHPVAGGSLVIALSDTDDPSGQRREIEQVLGAAGGAGQAALFFDGPGAAQCAQQARIIAELMGV